MFPTDDDTTSTSTITPIVGIGFFPPADSGDVTASASDELIENLEDDDRVTGEMDEFAVTHASPYITALLFLFLRGNTYFSFFISSNLRSLKLPASLILSSCASLANSENLCSSKHSTGETAVRKPSECRGCPGAGV